MNTIEIESRCKAKEAELLNRCFGNIKKENTEELPETIGNYSKDLPQQLETEYRDYLWAMWKELAPDDPRTMEQLFDKRDRDQRAAEAKREEVENAYREAERYTIGERLTKTNYKDVAYFKTMLKEYSELLLLSLRCDFIEDVAKLKGNSGTTYQPHAMDLSDVQLPDDIMQLAERIAENVHDTWAEQRIAQGWTYGPARDDEKRQTPCLVPYGELPESEKEYDRNTAISTLKMVYFLGFRIV